MDGDDKLIESALNYNFCNAPLVDTGVEITTDPGVFDQLLSIIFLASVPVTLPSADDA